MKQTIYVDVLISINLFINYFLLLSVAKILKLKVMRKRLVLAAFVGAIYSLIIFFPRINFVFSLIIRLIMSASIVLLAFRWLSAKSFIKIIMIFYGINFLFGGFIFCLWYFINPNGIFINNNMIYFNLSPLFLIFATFISYLLIRLFDRFCGHKNEITFDCEIFIKFKDKSIILNAKVDTGNTLKEPFSGLPVIVAQYKFIEEILPESIKEYFYVCNIINPQKKNLYDIQKLKDFRLVPFKTISGRGLLPAFKANYIKILSSNSQAPQKEAYIAVCKEKIFNDEYHALINPDLVE